MIRFFRRIWTNKWINNYSNMEELQHSHLTPQRTWQPSLPFTLWIWAMTRLRNFWLCPAGALQAFRKCLRPHTAVAEPQHSAKSQPFLWHCQPISWVINSSKASRCFSIWACLLPFVLSPVLPYISQGQIQLSPVRSFTKISRWNMFFSLTTININNISY